MLLLIICGGVLTSLGLTSCNELPTVKTPFGVVTGKHKKSYNGRIYSAFEGIPYGKPPVGELRFKEPQPAEKWEGELRANQNYMCLQYSPIPMMAGIMGDEDCLYLYIYIPSQTMKFDKLLDVVVHIHGGAFVIGAPFIFSAPDYIMDKDVVYVTMNYRLGILGFLSTEDDVVSGNNGLKDQSLALKWIKENIKYFGGNPDSITLTGQSAGGASVHYHYLSPLSKGLFNRGYSISGTALQPWALTKKPLKKAQKLAAALNCTKDTNQETVKCLRQLEAEELVTGILKFFVFIDAIPYSPFGPVVEKGKSPFLNDHPRNLLASAKIANDVPWISSNTKDEGMLPVAIFTTLDKLKELDDRWNEIIPYAMDFYDLIEDEASRNATSTKLREFYLQNESLTFNNTDKLLKLFTDRVYLINSFEALKLHSKASKSPVYFDFYSYIPEMPMLFKNIKPGSAHCDDSKLMFKLASNSALTKTDEAMKELLLDSLYTYATVGKPQVKNVDWKPVMPNMNYLDIQSPTLYSMKILEEWNTTQFWNSLKI